MATMALMAKSMENGKIRPLRDLKPLQQWTKKDRNRWLHLWDDPPLCKILCKSIHWRLIGKWVNQNKNSYPI